MGRKKGGNYRLIVWVKNLFCKAHDTQKQMSEIDKMIAKLWGPPLPVTINININHSPAKNSYEIGDDGISELDLYLNYDPKNEIVCSDCGRTIELWEPFLDDGERCHCPLHYVMGGVWNEE